MRRSVFCMRFSWCFCSVVSSVVSAKTYDEFPPPQVYGRDEHDAVTTFSDQNQIRNRSSQGLSDDGSDPILVYQSLACISILTTVTMEAEVRGRTNVTQIPDTDAHTRT